MTMGFPTRVRGVLAGSAVVRAVREALSGPPLTRGQLLQLAADTETSVREDPAIVGLSDDMRKVLDLKILEARQRWTDALSGSDDPRVWARATDRYGSDICNILRMIKRLNGGVLPDELYDEWVANQCS